MWLAVARALLLAAPAPLSKLEAARCGAEMEAMGRDLTAMGVRIDQRLERMRTH